MFAGVGKRTLRKSLLLFFIVALPGCGGGGGGGGGDEGGTPTYTLGGTITAPAGLAVDGDVNDPNEMVASNDTLDDAQVLSNPVSLGGYVNVAGAGEAGRSSEEGDPDDFFKVALKPGDGIYLAVGDSTTGDLDLYLYDRSGNAIAESIGNEDCEYVSAPADAGTYIVQVEADTGHSNYVLIIGPDPGDSAPSGPTLSTQHDFIPGEAIVRFTESAKAASSAGALSTRAAEMGLRMAAGVPGRAVLVSFREDYQRNEAFRALGIDARKRFGRGVNDELRRKRDTLRVIKELQKRPDVISAEPNYILKHHATVPDDEYYPLQWHYPLINLPQAWDITTGMGSGGDDVVVAVVDTGVLMGHPDLAGQLTDSGYDFINSTSSSNDGDGIDPDPDDPGDDAATGSSSFHGTHCAGTVAAAGNNGTGLAGVSWNARIMPIRVLGVDGGTLYDMLQGVRYAAGLENDSGTFPPRIADIISMSFGGGGYSAVAQALFTQVYAAGVILIAAAGNDAVSTRIYPAAYDDVISVSAVDISATLASYSNYGSHIDVAAPGGDAGDVDGDGYADGVWSTCGDDSTGTIRFNYAAQNGTSMATPHVAGVAALMKAVNPDLTPNDFDSHLKSGRITTDIGTADCDEFYGYGLIDAYKAVLAAQSDPETVLMVGPAALNFGTIASETALNVSKIGDDSLSVSDFSADADWLTVAANSIDGDGLGTYTVRVDRSVPEGAYTAGITFIPSSGSPVVVPVTMLVSSPSGSPDAGYHYVLLVNPDTFEPLQQVEVRAAEGIYSYAFNGVAPGRYLIVAGTDRDNDSRIDNAGESLGAYRSLYQITTVTVNDNRSDLNFGTDLRWFLQAPVFASGPQAEPDADALPALKRIR